MDGAEGRDLQVNRDFGFGNYAARVKSLKLELLIVAHLGSLKRAFDCLPVFGKIYTDWTKVGMQLAESGHVE